MSKVLVTGGAGFIGSHVADRLISAGYAVTVVDNLSHGRPANVPAQASFHQVDIRDREALEQVFAAERPDLIAHQAALANVRESLVKPAEYAEVNILGGINLLELARRYAVRKFVYACTGGAGYGEGKGKPPFRESDPVHPLDPYGVSKISFENYLFAYRHNFGLNYVSLRYANVYGPRQDPFGEAGVVAIFAQRMVSGQPCTIFGSGEKVRDFVYVQDVAQANLLALEKGSGIYNIGTGQPTDINRVFQDLKAGCSGYALEPRYETDKPGEVWASVLNPALAGQELGWQPRSGLREGMASTVAYFRAQAQA